MVGKYGLPPIPIERWEDTQAVCYYRGLAAGLDKAAREMGVAEEKDMEGSKFTIDLSKPMTKEAWKLVKPEGMTMAEHLRQYPENHYDRSPATIQRVVKYCLQDCRTEIGLSKAIGKLSPYERPVWELDQRINQRGLLIDTAYVRAAQAVVAEAKKPLLAEFDTLTGGLVPTQNLALVEWCRKNGAPQVDSLAKDKLKALGITGLDDDEDEADAALPDVSPLPSVVQRVLSIRAVLGSSSITKLGRMLACLSSDGRIRYTQQYHGAHTGRTAGRLIQPTNFPRGKIVGGHDPETLVRLIMLAERDPKEACDVINFLYGEPIAAVASGLRHAIVAGNGNVFDTGDFAGIEARGVLALAGQHDKCDLMASGVDVYLDMACDIYRRPRGSLNKKEHVPERTIGKNTVLGCGFGMGWQKFRERYCPDQPEEFAKSVVKAYRTQWAPEVPKLWAALEEAALKAVYDRTRTEAYGIIYEWSPGWLACHLPDGQTMWYRNPERCRKPMPWDASDVRDAWSYWCMKTGVWRRVYAYGGTLTENVVQKLARGWLVAASYRLEAAGFPLVLTVYDECMSEVPAVYADERAYGKIMAERTPYARSIKVPIEVETWEGPRYKK